MDKLILRTSDRVAFRRCRAAWDFGSKIRQNWEYVPGVEALDFGVAIHAALEVYYDPNRWQQDREIVKSEALIAFASHMTDWRKRLHRSEQWDLMEQKWREHNKLGRGMLHHFFSWAPEHDTYWVPLKAEIEFEVPIPVPVGFDLPSGFISLNGNLHKRDFSAIPPWQPIYYQGRIDLIARDTKTNRIYIWDHKTAAQFGDYEHLELDTQASSYAWVLKRILNVDVSGVIFQELRKKAPDEPKVLKSGGLSRDKSQNTTAKLYRDAIRKHSLNMAEYQDFIDALEVEGQEYFRRIQVDRTPIELEIIEGNVLSEALDMFDSPRIYPNPNRFNCGSCQYKEPCLMKQDGSDWTYYLEHSQLYEQRN